MSTKLLADKLGVTRRMQRPLIQQQPARLVVNVPSNARQNASSITPATRAAAGTRKVSAVIAAATAAMLYTRPASDQHRSLCVRRLYQHDQCCHPQRRHQHRQ